ncbi:MAG: hypothetical protein IPG85_05670 [Bacteroidetes bacterium]|nr:hypothetical protein [Bacteroidota bacterium]
MTHFKFDIQDEYDKWHIGLNQTKSTILSIAIRYETIFSFLKKKNTRIKPQLGVAFSPLLIISIAYPTQVINMDLEM